MRWAIAFVLVLSARVARADVVTIGAAADATLYAESGDLANGAGQHLFTGLTADGIERRGVIRFDVASALPAGSAISGVTLELALSRTRIDELEVGVHRVVAPWTEGTADAPDEEGGGALATAGDVTWTYASCPSLTWTPGGDFVATASAATVIARQLGPYTWSGAELTADVQGWLDDPAGNHGWILVATATGTRETKRFDTREHADANARPRLTITFTPPPASGACCADDGACTVVVDPGGACAGTYQGSGTSCATTACAQPTGGCCLPDAAGTCAELTAAACDAQGGQFEGIGAACSSGSCPIVLEPFVDPLPVPVAAVPIDGGASYRIAIRETAQRLHRDLPLTRVWGFDDGTGARFPGPTLEARRGVPLTVEWQNDLRDDTGAPLTTHRLGVDACLAEDAAPRTVIHLHGGHVPAASDGYPESTWLPGESAVYEYPNAQPAATLWYHDHAMGITRLNVVMGLAGFYLIRDDAEDALGLPSGADEIPLAIQDRTFAADGSLVYPAAWQDHVLGDTILVNGVVWPYLAVRRGKYRLRILDGSTSRSYRLALSDGAPFTVIGSDGGLLAAPVTVAAVTLTPGERVDVVVDFAGYASGTEVILRDDDVDVMKFVVGSEPGHTAPLPAALVEVPRLDEAEASMTRDLRLERVSDACAGTRWTIGGLGWDDITGDIPLGSVEVWRFINPTGETHPMHLHLVQMQILDRQASDGAPTPPAPIEAGWKDTVAVAPFEVVRVIARFEDYAGLFPYHCHILEHEDHAMMRQFRTIELAPDGGVPDGGTSDDAAPDAGAGAEPGDDAGCGCRGGGSASAGAAVMLLVLAIRRRR